MRSKAVEIFIMMILILCIGLLFGSYGLYSWSVTLDGPVGYHLFYSPLKKLNDWNSSWGGTLFVDRGRDLWEKGKDSLPIRFRADLPMLVEMQDNELLEEKYETEKIPLAPVPLFSGETLDFLVLGDSLANSIGKQLEPLINDYSDMTCRVEGVISSNLIRLDYYDWLNEGPRFAREASYDCILIFLGANTMQSFFLEGQRVSLFSEEWKKIYKERAGELLDALKGQKGDVYWMLLPPMQKESYDKNIQILNGLIDEICEEKGIKRLSYNSLITTEKGLYLSEKVVNDKQILLRSDGIHFTREGAEYISRYLIGSMRKTYGLPDIPEEEDEMLTTGEIQP